VSHEFRVRLLEDAARRDPAGHAAAAEAAAGARESRAASNRFVTLDGEDYCRIDAVDSMAPFLMNLPTDTDLWMFVSSAGGLTAGRRDPDGALFPYETVDRLHDALHHTGPVTLIRWRRAAAGPALWEPLAPGDAAPATTGRSLAKNVLGNRLVFEERHPEAQLAFRYRWAGSDETGWVRTARVTNLGRERVTLSLLDGLRNVLPSGAPLRLHQQSSCLVDAYRRADVDRGTGLGVFSLTSKISDRPEPAESLRAAVVWCHGLSEARVALSLEALRAFRRGAAVPAEHLLTGRRGNYLVHATLSLEPGAHAEWHIAADAERSHAQIAAVRARLRRPEETEAWIRGALDGSSANLRRIVGSADGLQLTRRPDVTAHHLANVLFNSLRGGVFVSNHSFPRSDFARFLEVRHREAAARHAAVVAALPAETALPALLRAADATGDPDFRRLCLEYLPLYFGRRHGDPSRPWNRFSIHVRNADGSQALHYEGNWRDVFQNWEALTRSFPGFLPGIIAKFVNASTVDGFNPYRITSDGVEWEVHDPKDPWSGIGYWGDHQIVYLLRLLESLHHHHPGALEAMLGQEIFSYADVPYRIRPYAEVVAHPRATIVFDDARDARIAGRVAARGTDGRLLHADDGSVHHASLLEKLLVPALAKVSSLVPDGGIWMNTERPEWNDANNALAGTGLSVVTLCHLRRYLRFLEETLAPVPDGRVRVASAVVDWLRRTAGILRRHRDALAAERVDDRERRAVMDELGAAFSDYRERAYAEGLPAKVDLDVAEVLAWCAEALAHVDHAIRANRRDDGLYHSYNLLALAPDGSAASIQPLAEMLEGQVAVLGSGLLDGAESTRLVARLFASRLYRADCDSFLLYPDRELPGFLARNAIPDERAAGIPLVAELLAAGDSSVIERDADGVLRFHGDFATSRDVAAALDRLAANPLWARPVARDRGAVVELFAEVFAHRTFTGRSGRMYAYEGLGCVYWHMVGKLLLAVQEAALAAHERGEPAAVREALARDYYRIRAGLGFEKPAREYGAFPTDPYSHTPAHAGAQQPGMTGAVKEEILTRLGELGVRVRGGRVGFDPVLLRRDEFLQEPGRYAYFDRTGAARSLEVPARSLAFTCCQVPVLYTLTPGEAWIRAVAEDEVATERAGAWLDRAASALLIGRLPGLARIEVGVPEAALRDIDDRKDATRGGR
jgi:hypothetical protein